MSYVQNRSSLFNRVFYVAYYQKMPAATPSSQRSKSKKRHPKRNQSQTSQGLVPGIDYPLLLPDDPSVVIPGFTWAKQHGYAHIHRVSKEDAMLILDKLQVNDNLVIRCSITDAFAALTNGNPWYWIEQFAKAGGDLTKLHVESKK